MPSNNRILLVEDEPTIAVPLVDDLQAHGFDVTHAADGATALSVVASSDFDAVITDLRLPGADGGQVVRMVRGRCPRAVVVVVTAWLADRTTELMRDGADAIFEKPFANERVVDWLLDHGLAAAR